MTTCDAPKRVIRYDGEHCDPMCDGHLVGESFCPFFDQASTRWWNRYRECWDRCDACLRWTDEQERNES